eukprot:6174480-Pleurochrysis_carterae.AAC.2
MAAIAAFGTIRVLIPELLFGLCPADWLLPIVGLGPLYDAEGEAGCPDRSSLAARPLPDAGLLSTTAGAAARCCCCSRGPKSTLVLLHAPRAGVGAPAGVRAVVCSVFVRAACSQAGMLVTGREAIRAPPPFEGMLESEKEERDGGGPATKGASVFEGVYGTTAAA